MARRPAGVHVALLRAINVGGNNKVPMKLLSELFTRAGASDVRTYIQSGNVVFRAVDADAVGAGVGKALARSLSIDVPIVLRTRAELHETAERSPFADRDPAGARLHVAFLAHAPTPAQLAAAAARATPPEELALRGRDLYLSFPNGVARTKLTNVWLDKTLATTSTLRNWRTVLALVALADAL